MIVNRSNKMSVSSIVLIDIILYTIFLMFNEITYSKFIILCISLIVNKFFTINELLLFSIFLTFGKLLLLYSALIE